MDTAETQEPNAGSIPDPIACKQEVVEQVVQDLAKEPPVPFDPKMQHKRNFREHAGGRAHRMIALNIVGWFQVLRELQWVPNIPGSAEQPKAADQPKEVAGQAAMQSTASAFDYFF